MSPNSSQCPCGGSIETITAYHTNDIGVVTRKMGIRRCEDCGTSHQKRVIKHIPDNLINQIQDYLRSTADAIRKMDDLDTDEGVSKTNANVMIVVDQDGTLQRQLTKKFGRDIGGEAASEINRVLTELARIHVSDDADWVYPPVVVAYPDADEIESGVRCRQCGHDLQKSQTNSPNGEHRCQCGVCGATARLSDAETGMVTNAE